MELVSIVVPVYNIEKYIGNCIESIQKQTYENIEILLIDDGAKDESGAICDCYAQKDRRIRVFHKENGGLSDARNYGAQQVRGKYMLFIDGDDTISSELVEKTLDCAEKTDGDLVFFDFESVEEETGRRDLYHYGLPEKKAFSVYDHPEILLKSPSACCCLYKKEFWDKSDIRYPLERHYEDLATTPRFMLKAQRIGYTGEKPLYYYMLRKGSIMHSSNFERSFKDRTWVLDFLREYFYKQQAEKKFQKELEYMFFEHGYFIPLKEVILEDPKSPWISRFGEYVSQKYPDFLKNPYIRQNLSKKDQIMLFLMKKRLFWAMNLLSAIRKKSDSLKK